MPIPTTEIWRATIEGRPDLSIEFPLPIGCEDGHARMRAWECWAHARANGSNDPNAPVPSRWLRVAKVATGMVALPELAAA
jgi:hypothetical protein